jgi:hypothetical protein
MNIEAICGSQRDKNPDHIWTENDWNDDADINKGAYSYSKTMAEKAAWELSKELGNLLE